jgi:fatty acid desaturase
MLRLVFFGALLLVVTHFGWWPHYFLFWIVPLVTFYPVVLFLREIAHHGNAPDDGDFTNSRIYRARWLEREIFFPYGEAFHVLHHMFPGVPHRFIHRAHEVLLHYPPYRDNVVRCNGFFIKADRQSTRPSVLDILAVPADFYLRGKLSKADPNDLIRRKTEAEVGAMVGAAVQPYLGFTV